ncbi:MAG: fasciclin domain-containing protein [Balneolales bacterium]|nr:fasciclin domain-containing protein [Balneolales bacterium]
MKNKILRLFAVPALALALFAACSDDDPLTPQGDPSIAEIANTNMNFSILNDLLELTGLDETLESGDFTVFAPTDAAFNALPEGTLESLSVEQAREIILFHAVAGSILSSQLQASQDVETVQGERLLVRLSNGQVRVNADAIVGDADIEASNGVDHVINRVLLPSEFREPSIIETATAAGGFTTLLGALETTGLTTTFKYLSPFTVFAPTDEAFAEISETVAGLTTEQLTAVLTYHVLGSTVRSTDLSPSQSVATLNGQEIEITVGEGGAFVNGDSEIVDVDIESANGVIHVINKVLIPQL